MVSAYVVFCGLIPQGFLFRRNGSNRDSRKPVDRFPRSQTRLACAALALILCSRIMAFAGS